MTRGNETSSHFYIKYASEKLFWLFKIALLIMPWIAIVFAIVSSIVSLLLSDDDDSAIFLPFFVYLAWTELSIFGEALYSLYRKVKGEAH